MNIFRALLIPLVLGAVLLGADLLAVQSHATQKAGLTFSNTMTWDPSLVALRDQKTHYPIETYATISLPPPPSNGSEETKKELTALISYKSLRTEQEVKNILAEASPDTLKMGDYSFTQYLDGNLNGKMFPATARLLKDSFQDISIITLQQKQKFNRVRPSFLEPSIDPVIAIPGHPAYPSGHSTQAHFLAHVLGELMPDRKAELIARADEIAKNREIAGLHYPSDSAAGVLLAQQFFAIMMQNKEFQGLLAAAKQEWR